MPSDIAHDGLSRDGLQGLTLNRLACLARHWMWADDAKARFEQTFARGWEYEVDPLADRLFGDYYHWCALLCGVGEAALSQGILSRSHLYPLEADLQACLPVLRRCRDVLVSVPTSREALPRVVDLLRDGETLRRLRRVHRTVGELLREEQRARDLELLDTHER